MINICFFLGSFSSGGAEEHVLSIVNNIDRKKFNPTVAVYRKEGPLLSEFENANIKILEYNSRYSRITQIFKFAKDLDKNKVHILHSHLLGGILFSFIASLFSRVNIRVMTLHNIYKDPL